MDVNPLVPLLFMLLLGKTQVLQKNQCREKMRLIGTDKEDQYMLVDASLNGTISLDCHYWYDKAVATIVTNRPFLRRVLPFVVKFPVTLSSFQALYIADTDTPKKNEEDSGSDSDFSSDDSVADRDYKPSCSDLEHSDGDSSNSEMGRNDNCNNTVEAEENLIVADNDPEITNVFDTDAPINVGNVDTPVLWYNLNPNFQPRLKHKKIPLLQYHIPLAEQMIAVGKQNATVKRKRTSGRPTAASKLMLNVGDHLPVEGETRRRCGSKLTQKKDIPRQEAPLSSRVTVLEELS
ncbi:hypothetical protein C0J52_09728 [Blattella germanica]|nr:hypothetical protein C0J52_09728 [Blattella germanica]